MASRFAPLFPRRETHLLLSRAGGAGSSFIVDGIDVRAGEPAALEAFATEIGFPVGWAGEMLAEGAWAVVAAEPASGATLAMGWAIGRPFHVEEIAATIDPGAGGGVYLFGDYVAPAARGRRLQRLLVAERLRRISGGRACTIVHPDNVASMRSYREEGFEVTGRFTRTSWLGRSRARCSGVGFAMRDGTIRAV